MKTKDNVLMISAMLLIGAIGFLFVYTPGEPVKIDDWQYTPGNAVYDAMRSMPSALNNIASGGIAKYSAESMGYSVGGAKDINNFRENINNGYLPLGTDITYEGLFYDYYFDTGKSDDCTELFCPSYSYAVTVDPLSNKSDYYMTVGLDSNMKENDFQRRPLNLVIVMDISGSMSSPFDRYYYDKTGTDENFDKQKIDAAKEAMIGLIDHLNDNDRLGVVLFNDGAKVAKPLNLLETTDADKLKEHITEINADGGTMMSAGYKEALSLLEEYEDDEEHENRIIFLTDAMPNLGETSEDGLLGMANGASDDGIYTTFIGIGVDFNTELVEKITKTKGANYYSVHSPKEFLTRMDDEFELMVTPMVFDLTLEFESDGFEILNVYGSPDADKATGKVMEVSTLFPSRSQEGEVRGGVILLKLKKIYDSEDATLSVTYKDREGEEHETEKQVILTDVTPEFFENIGVRKAVLLSRYADLMKDWIMDERSSYPEPIIRPYANYEKGIICPPIPYPQLGKWERQSIDLRVSGEYEKMFGTFQEYFKDEMEAIGDDTLEKEINILDKLA